MFERPHHRRIAQVLSALDGRFLGDNQVFFGGGTAITLSHGEYRESVDIDLLVSDRVGYRNLRRALTLARALAPVLREGEQLELSREIIADQYGIRALIAMPEGAIKFEVILEARIEFVSHDPQFTICGVPTLSPFDFLTSKLLANSDRWADDSVFSRDLIDLAMLNPSRKQLESAIEKAAGAYGDSIERDLARAIAKLKARPGRLIDCMQALKMLDVPAGVASVPPALLWKRIRRLTPKTSRVKPLSRRGQ